jgi:hypothetical protein
MGKASAKRKVNGVERIPAHPFQLVRYTARKPLSDVTI